jgi:hypothetical protein
MSQEVVAIMTGCIALALLSPLVGHAANDSAELTGNRIPCSP